jgi:DNA-binding SARP family transcriptional activator
MEFRVLGPLDVRRDGRSIDLRGSKRRTVLAIFVLHANEVVRTDRLIEELWGEDRPANASAALHNHVSRLRKDLGDDVLVTKPWGYVLRTDPEGIDLRRFERLVAEAKSLAAHERTEKLLEALALWRGPALADLAREPALAGEIARLDELRLSALEHRLDADLELGGHEELVGELEALVAEHPLRERLRGQLILALYRSGRQAEALETYRETRRVLVEELGIEPSPELRELERAILRQDPSLGSAPPPPEPADAEPAQSGWRWPRSPLVAGGLVLVLAAAGGATAVVMRTGGAPHEIGALPVAHTAAANPSPPATTARKKSADKSPVGKSSSTAKAEPASATTAKSHSRGSAPVRPTGVPEQGRPLPIAHRPTTPPKRAGTTKPKPKPKPTPKPTKPPPPAKVYWLTDDFEDPAFDLSRWQRATGGSGWDFIEREGRLEIGLAADSVTGDPWNSVEGHYGTQCRLLGDFDARVEFELLTWPEASGATLDMGAYFTHAESTPYIARFSFSSGGDGYSSWFPPNLVPVATMDTAGSLRLRRHRGVMTTYYRHAGRWVKINSGAAPGARTIVLQLYAGADFAHKAVRVALDNFSAEAEAVDCAPGIPVPPRKARS